MLTIEEIRERLEIGEKGDLECKEAVFSVPKSVFESYSAFANTNGGLILLGVKENKKPVSYEITGVVNPNDMIKDFWDQINDPRRCSQNVLTDAAVYCVNDKDKSVIVIEVPRADYNSRPVYIGDNLYSGTYKRNHEGDYHCSKEETDAMIRDKSPEGNDGVIFEGFTMDDLDEETVRKYRTVFGVMNPSHVWLDLPDKEFMQMLGGYDKDRKTGVEGLTLAGLLMFGKGVVIRNKLSNIFMDYRDQSNTTEDIRWNDRVTYDGTWENNLYNFFFKTSQKLTNDLPKPFHLEGMTRIDDTPVHKAVREALINMIIHADYFVQGTLKVIKYADRYEISNPGTLKLSKEQIYQGGNSKARNPRMQTMLRMIGYGDNAGSGFPTILSAWKQQGWEEPDLEENFELNQVTLTLLFAKQAIIPSEDAKQAKIPSEDSKRRKTKQAEELIKKLLKEYGPMKTSELAQKVQLSEPRVRAILSEMVDIVAIGNTTSRKYMLKEDLEDK